MGKAIESKVKRLINLKHGSIKHTQCKCVQYHQKNKKQQQQQTNSARFIIDKTQKNGKIDRWMRKKNKL